MNCFDVKSPLRHPKPPKFGPIYTFKIIFFFFYSHVYDESDESEKLDELDTKVKSIENERKSMIVAFSEFTKKVENKFEILQKYRERHWKKRMRKS